LAPLGGPPGGPPRGAKTCTFFWAFNNSPSRDSLGLPGGPGDTPAGPPILAPIRGTCGGQCLWDRLTPRVACPRWAGPLGRRASDGYPLAGLTANGWYVPSGRGPPSKQGRKSAQYREVMGRRRPFAIAKRGPTTGVTGKVRKYLVEQARPYPVPGILHPIAVRQDLSLWAWTADRPAMGHIRAANLRHPHLVNLEAELLTTTARKKECIFWQILEAELAGWPRMAPRTVPAVRRATGKARLH